MAQKNAAPPVYFGVFRGCAIFSGTSQSRAYTGRGNWQNPNAVFERKVSANGDKLRWVVCPYDWPGGNLYGRVCATGAGADTGGAPALYRVGRFERVDGGAEHASGGA